MFSYDAKLTNLDALANWDTSSLEQTGSMFLGCSGLKSISGLKNWDTSSLRDSYEMFLECSNLTSLDGLENWNTSNLLVAGHMFTRCSKLTDISAVKNWDMSYAVDITKMFKQCTSLTDISPVAGWKLTADNLFEMFYGCTALQDASALSSMDVSNAVTFTRIFGGCSKLTAYPEWNGTWGSDGTLTVDTNDTRINLNDCELTSLQNTLSLCVGSVTNTTIRKHRRSNIMARSLQKAKTLLRPMLTMTI